MRSFVLLIGAGTLLFLSVVGLAGESKNITLLKKFDAAWNAHDLQEAMAFYADDAVVITPDGKTLKGKAEIAAREEPLMAGFHVESINIREEGNQVMWDFIVHSDFFAAMGVNPVKGSGTMEIVNGKVTSFIPVFNPETVGKLTTAGFFRAYDEGMPLEEIAAQFFAADARVHLTGVPAPLDVNGYQQFGAAFRQGFPDGKHQIEFQLAEGEWVATRVTYSSTHTGQFQGTPASNKPVRITGVIIDRVVNGKIVERWAEFDTMGLMMQIGALPTPEQAHR